MCGPKVARAMTWMSPWTCHQHHGRYRAATRRTGVKRCCQASQMYDWEPSPRAHEHEERMERRSCIKAYSSSWATLSLMRWSVFSCMSDIVAHALKRFLFASYKIQTVFFSNDKITTKRKPYFFAQNRNLSYFLSHNRILFRIIVFFILPFCEIAFLS